MFHNDVESFNQILLKITHGIKLFVKVHSNELSMPIYCCLYFFDCLCDGIDVIGVIPTFVAGFTDLFMHAFSNISNIMCNGSASVTEKSKYELHYSMLVNHHTSHGWKYP